MQGIACGNLLSPGGRGLVVAPESQPKRTLPLQSPQNRGFNSHALGRDLGHRLVERNGAIERRGGADHAVTAEHARFDKLPTGQTNDERHDTVWGK